MASWLEALDRLAPPAGPAVRVLVVESRGSVPREAGAFLLIHGGGVVGTIGGGQLEYRAVERGRAMLAAPPGEMPDGLHRYPLGPGLGQCCGGLAVLLFERVDGGDPAIVQALRIRRGGADGVLVTRFTPEAGLSRRHAVALGPPSALAAALGPTLDAAARARLAEWSSGARPILLMGMTPDSVTDTAPAGAGSVILESLQDTRPHLVLFGAGHVGRAVVTVFRQLPWRISWVDGRADAFPPAAPEPEGHSAISDSSLRKLIRADWAAVVDEMPADAYFLVMTHDHGLDALLCDRILQREDFRWLGLIGSLTKRRRFEKRLGQWGRSAEQLARLVCPVGLSLVPGKLPGAISVAVAAQLLAEAARPPGCQSLAVRSATTSAP